MRVRQGKRYLIGGAVLFVLSLLFACGNDNNDDESLGGAGGETPIASTPTDDAFTWTGNTRLRVVPESGLLANDPPDTTIIAADTVSTRGGRVQVDMGDGAFTYDPPVGLQNVDDTFRYTVGGASSAVTVTITLNERVWYVRNDATGADQGNDTAPFLTLAQAERESDENDTLFVFAGDRTDTGQNGGITLTNGQRLLGEGVGLTVNGVPLVDPVPQAVISNRAPGGGGITPVVLLSTGNEVAGFAIETAFNEGILASGGSGHHLHDNSITFDPINGREGIRLLNLTGSNAVIANTIEGSPRNGIKVVNNEDLAGNIVAATPIIATVTMSRNIIGNSERDGILVNLSGIGTDVALQILTNTIDLSGTLANVDEGINIDSLGAAHITAVISRNTVTNSAGEAMDLAVDVTSSMAAFVANSDLSVSGAVDDFLAATQNPSVASLCLELINNVSVTAPLVPSTFRADNNSGTVSAFQFFEALNDTLAAINPPNSITAVPEGTCAITLPGAALFTANCAICHRGNGLGFGNIGPDITNAALSTITLQLTNNPSMNDIRLIPSEIEAISRALSPLL